MMVSLSVSASRFYTGEKLLVMYRLIVSTLLGLLCKIL